MRSSSVEPLPVPSAVRAARQPRFGLLFRSVALLGEALHWLVASALLEGVGSFVYEVQSSITKESAQQ